MDDGSGRISFKKGKDTYVMNPNDGNKTTFIVPHDASVVKERRGITAVKDKAFPDIFEWVDNTFDEENWASMENKFRVESAISDNIQDRAIALGFVTSPDYNLLSSADYPENFFRDPNQLSREVSKASIPRYDDSTTSGGFYLEGSSTANPISPRNMRSYTMFQM